MQTGCIVSVLMPLYNHASTVESALTSVLHSDCANIELIICDDASQDSSFEVARTWLDRHRLAFARALILRNSENTGITANLNRLIGQARGDFVTLLASDDELTAHAVDLQREFLQTHPDLDFVFANCAVISADGQALRPTVVSDWQAGIVRRRSCALVDIVFNWGLPWTRLFARRQAFMALGTYISDHALEDRWSALKIAQTRRFGYMHTVVHRYRLRKEAPRTAGLDPVRLFRDFYDTERRLIPETSGLLHLLLRLRVWSLPGEESGRFLFLRKLLRLSMTGAHLVLVGQRNA